VSAKLDETWASLEAHKPDESYADAWRVMLKERTCAAAWAAHHAAPAGSAAWWAAAAWATAAWAKAARVERHAQDAIGAIKEVKP
jgi:hypothetical protein